jgi:hypothetical protein
MFGLEQKPTKHVEPEKWYIAVDCAKCCEGNAFAEAPMADRAHGAVLRPAGDCPDGRDGRVSVSGAELRIDCKPGSTAKVIPKILQTRAGMDR